MQPLNYSRQLLKHFDVRRTSLYAHPDLAKAGLDRIARGVKFLLPDGGMALEDRDFVALDGNESVDLPFPLTTLEFSVLAEFDGAGLGTHRSTKRIVSLARTEAGIEVFIACWIDAGKVWDLQPPVLLKLDDCLAPRFMRDKFGYVMSKYYADVSGMAPVLPPNDYGFELRVVLGFLNALACANVTTEVLPRPARMLAPARKGALPFDQYRVLTIRASAHAVGAGGVENDRHSPREHVRRGHIRRLVDGRRIWVNAAVINAGKGYGRVHKDYQMRA